MDERVGKHLLPPTIDLAREPDLVFGHVRVRPSICTVEFPGRSERLEPRVMQVLVALARAGGGVLTKDELIDRCWGGRIVGEAAINRTLARLRQLAQVRQPPAFEIETIPKVGYRLVAPAAPPARRRRPWVLAAAGGAALAVVGGAAALVATLAAPRAWSIESYGVLAGEDHAEGWPDVSPDGRRVVYTVSPASEHPQSDIWMRSLSGGEAVALVRSPAPDLAPAWSPGGDEIAFVRGASAASAGPCRILVKAVPDGIERLVGRCRSDRYLTRLAWTPAGDAIVFAEHLTRGGPRVVRRLDLRTRRTRDLTSPPRGAPGDHSATVSPDGRTLAFVRYSSELSAGVFTQAMTGGQPRRLTRDAGSAWIDWSHDGKDLFVASATAGPPELYSIDARRGGKPKRLLLGLQTVVRPSAGPGVIAIETGSSVMEVVRSGRAGEARVTSGGDYAFPDVSSHGDLAFLSSDGRYHIELQRSGEPLRRLLDLDRELVHPRGLTWSPDGRRLAFAAARGGKADLFLVDVEAASVTRLPVAGLQASSPAWSPDGASLYFAAEDRRGPGIWRVGVDAARPPDAVARGPWADVRVESGVLYAARFADGGSGPQGGVWRIEPGGGARLAAAVPLNCLVEVEDWRIAGSNVYALSTDAQGLSSLGAWPLNGGPPAAPRNLGHAGSFAMDPRNGEMVVLRTLHTRDDIGVARIRRRRG